jgi:transposase InsO family protein
MLLQIILTLLQRFLTILLPSPSLPRYGKRRLQQLPVRVRTRRKPAWVRREVIRLKALTDQSCHKLAATFNRQHAALHQITVGKTWVAEVVRTHRYEIAELRRKYHRRVPAPQQRNAVWGLDFTGKADLGCTVHPVLGIIDHGSRRALALRPLREQTAIATLRALLVAAEMFGLPRTLRTDNGAVFTSRLFRFAMCWLGIRHHLSTPGCPWQNGRIERLFGTLKEKLNQFAVPDFASLEMALFQFGFWYNHVRPHQHLCGWTPADAWNGRDPYLQVPRASLVFNAWEGLLTGIYLKR